ncbi:hypothetical protein [Streptomyces sp. AGS-58]|uniref:hypothetical protein n=1 Tax=unclassified Streptomyces TaxID=2593676 RepID=UPI0035A292B2
MDYREPRTGGPDQTAGGSADQAVWENELPWQLAPLGETGQGGPPPAGDLPGHGTAARNPETAVLPAASVPAARPDTAFASHEPTTGERDPGPDPLVAPGARRRRDRGHRPDTPAPEAAGDGRARLRLALAKPVLAGAGMIGALFLLTPTVFGEDAPAHTFKAGAGDTDGDYASAGQYPDTGSGVSSRPSTSSGTPGKDGAGDGGSHRIAEVAAASPTPGTRSVEPMSQSHTPAPSGTPRTSSTPRPRQSPSSQPHWTTAVVNGTRVLEPGQSWSTNRIMLAFQGDGNLVLYDTKGTPLWWAGTVGQGAKAVFQADGNFAVYTQDGATAWSSRTDGHDGAQLVLGADGDVTIRSGGAVLWSTGTAM